MMKPVLGSQLQGGHPLAQGLVCCWLMNEGAGSLVNDLSGNENTGTFGSGTTSPIWTHGNSGPAVQFTEASEMVITSNDNPTLHSYSAFTVVAAVRLLDSPDNDIIAIHRNTNPNPDVGWYMSAVGTEYRFYVYANAGGKYADTGAGTITVGATQLVVGTYDGEKVRTYIDGIGPLETSAATSGDTGDTVGRAMEIGGDYLPIDQLIEYFMIYNRALAPSEITSLTAKPFQMFRRRPIELWTAATSVGAAPATGYMTLNTGYWG